MTADAPLAAAALALLITSAQLAAIYMRIETRQVPIDRLVANLERELKADPTNVQTLINLARLHAMAFALKVDEFPGAPAKPDQPEAAFVSSRARARFRRPSAPPHSPEHAARAAQHLKEAIRHYEAALALAPDNLTARLGHGWILATGGRQARQPSRNTVWSSSRPGRANRRSRRLMPSQRLFTQEAAGYLIPLLDKERDAAEIADLRAKQARHRRDVPRAITPIAIPLTDNCRRARTSSIRWRASASTPMAPSPREWTWITPEAGWLVYDADGRGTITSALQLVRQRDVLAVLVERLRTHARARRQRAMANCPAPNCGTLRSGTTAIATASRTRRECGRSLRTASWRCRAATSMATAAGRRVLAARRALLDGTHAADLRRDPALTRLRPGLVDDYSRHVFRLAFVRPALSALIVATLAARHRLGDGAL